MGDSDHGSSEPEELLTRIEDVESEDKAQIGNESNDQEDEEYGEFQDESITPVETTLPQFYKPIEGDKKEDKDDEEEPVTPTRTQSKSTDKDDEDDKDEEEDDDESLPSRNGASHSRQGSIQMQGLSPSPAIPSTPSSNRSPGMHHHSIDQRFQTRLSSLSPTKSPNSSTLSMHLRTASQLSANIDDLTEESGESPWEALRWTKLRKLSNQLYSDDAISTYGRPTAMLPSANIAVGTSRGLVLVFDYHQNLKHVLSLKHSTREYGEVTALTVSADQTYIGVGYSKGHITTWDLTKSTVNSPNLHIAPIANDFIGDPQKEGHLAGTPIIHLNFTGKRHSALVSGDLQGMVFSHNAVRALVGRTVKTTKVLGKYPQNSPSSRRKPTSILACSVAPLGTEVEPMDELGLVAVMTPYMLAVISTIPRPQTEYKVSKYKDASLDMGLSACLAWFPALRGPNPSVPKFAYCWSNVLTITEVHSSKNAATESVDLRFTNEKRYVGDEAIVSIQWISRQIIGLVTITQRLLILNEVTMTVCEQIDLINKHVMHHDYFSRVLHNLTIPHTDRQQQQQQNQPVVVADAYFNSIKSFKGRIFLVGKYEFVVGSLSNWADRLLDIMESGDYVKAIRLATSYYIGHEDMITIGLPRNDSERHQLVKKNLPDMVMASLKYTFRGDMDPPIELVRDLTDACFTAVIAMGDVDTVLNEVFEFYESSNQQKIFFESLVPFIYDGEIKKLPPSVFKSLVLEYSKLDQYELLEELICSLDTQTLDLDFTLSLCEQYHLKDTQVYIWNHALQDFITPLDDFVKLITRFNRGEDLDEVQAKSAEKVYPYLSYILTGRIYPTGLMMTDAVTAYKARSHIYYYLFAGSNGDESYPELYALLLFNCSAVFAALNEAFEDAFLNDTDSHVSLNGLESSDKIAFGQAMNRQYLINSLLDLFSIKELGPEYRVFLNIFIARNYPKYSQFLILPGNTLSKVLEELCYNDDPSLDEERELAIQSLLSKYKPPDLDKLILLLQETRLFKVLQFVYRKEGRYTKLLETTIRLYREETSTVNDYNLMGVLQECLQKVNTKKDRNNVEEQIIDNFEALTQLNSQRFVSLVSQYCPHLHDQVFKLDNRTDLQYFYLKRLFEMAKSSGTTKLPSVQARHLYVSLLIKQGETSLLMDMLTSVLTNVDDVDLPNIVDDLIEARAIDVLVLLLQRRDRLSEAMIYIVDHLVHLDGNYSESDISESQLSNTEKELSRYVYIGMNICLEAEDRVEKSENEGKDATEVEESLGEQVWARLIDTMVDIARPKDSEEEEEPHHLRREQFRRGLLEKVLSTLLESTGRYVSNIQHNSTIIRIFRSVLGPQAAKSRTLGSVRPILNDLFAAYRYQYTMLTVARQLLDHDTYESLLNLVSVRLEGWKISKTGECEGCGRKIIGVGVDAEWLYSQWQDWQKRTMSSKFTKQTQNVKTPKLSKKALGKLPVTPEFEAEELRKEDANMLVVFKCCHAYHLGCLRNLGGQSKDLECIVCS